MKHIFLIIIQMILFTGLYAQSSCVSISADFDTPIIDINETTFYTVDFAESSGEEIWAGEIEITISFPLNGEYVNNSGAVPTGSAAGLFDWSWTDTSTDKFLYGTNPNPIGAFDGGEITVEILGVSMTSAPEVTNVTMGYAFNGAGCADNDASDLEVSSVVPVILSSFNADNKDCNTNDLAWSTSSEINSKGFEIQRSLDGTSFTTIGFVPSLENAANGQRNYTYTDSKLGSNGTYYYRLKQIDFDGQTETFNIEAATVRCDEDIIVSLFPNPAIEQINLSLDGIGDRNVDLFILSASGQLVKRINSFDSSLGIIDISDLDAGMYFLKIKTNSEIIEENFIKLK